ncbi:hypothetical protein [Conexibacter sp. DBS9H8]|uniref:hypothetical protein n=1 Tax=Conexibacter sp. DBS9H8 TaxID=2937801 RepID=UPI0020104802|nr:hypothetical protein [Conexibacter sp. DBS9H8]
MRQLPSRALKIAAVSVLSAVAASSGYALASPSGGPKVIRGCVEVHARVLLVKPRCGRGQHRITWNVRGPEGPQGVQGPAGPSPVTAFGVAEPGGQVRVQQGGTLTAGLNGAYEFRPSAAPTVVNTCAATATPVQAPNPTSLAPSSADTVTESEYHDTSGYVIGWQFQVFNSAGQPVNDGIAVSVSCPIG